MIKSPIIAKNINGVPIFGPISFFQIPEDEIRLLYNGCGSGNIGSKVTPDSMYGLDISMLCNIHDHMYENCTCEQDEIEADAILSANLITLITTKSTGILKWLRLFRATKYIVAVSATTFSEEFWEINKNKRGYNGDCY